MKHVPERSCIVCRTKQPQSELIRWTKIDGVWHRDQGKKRVGRGVYLCKRTECWQEKRLRRVFGTSSTVISASYIDINGGQHV